MEFAIAISAFALILSLSTMHCCKRSVKMTAYLCIKSSPAEETLVLFANWLIIYNSSI